MDGEVRKRPKIRLKKRVSLDEIAVEPSVLPEVVSDDTAAAERPPTKAKAAGKKRPHHHRQRYPHSHPREVALQGLYQLEVARCAVSDVLRLAWLGEPMAAENQEFALRLIREVADHSDALDRVILSFSHIDYSQISTINRCLLRMALMEIMQEELPLNMLINDYLELTRTYDGEESVGFINGVLDSFYHEKKRLQSQIGI